MTADPSVQEGDALRSTVRTWLKQNWDPRLPVADWWQRVFDAGWSAPYFPTGRGGRGLPREGERVVRDEFRQAGALGAPTGMSVMMAAPTILAHGTDDQIRRHVEPILTGRAAWCQLFSEPGSGSDLASLTTRAERDGDRWIITGQKVWSSGAQDADYGMLLARTDFDRPKHAGISWFAFNMRQPGVDIRPLREMTGRAIFNEVFLDGAVCADEDLIGGEGAGWRVAQTTLLNERIGIGAGSNSMGFPVGGSTSPVSRAADAGAGVALDPGPQESMMVSADEVLALAREYGRSNDPLIRQKLALLTQYIRTGQWTGRRAAHATSDQEGYRLSMLGKIAQTQIVQLTADLIMDILGPEAMLWAPDGPRSGRYTEFVMFSRASSIYGGTDQIQRNIIAERVLGLPREASDSRGQPFRKSLQS